MLNIYYTAREGKRNANGHTTTKGTVYIIDGDELKNIGNYNHTSGGAGIELAILTVAEQAGIDTNGGYCKDWRSKVRLIKL